MQYSFLFFVQDVCIAKQKDHQPCPASDQAAILNYGEDFMEQFSAVMKNPDHGATITSCICHGK